MASRDDAAVVPGGGLEIQQAAPGVANMLYD